MKRLNELFENQSDIKIYSIHSDSRYVRRNSIFFCIEGLSVDGHQYVDDAIFQGAKVVVYSKELHSYNPNIIYIKVADTLDELNRVSNIFYDYPSKKLKVVGVTGTSGKTVVASMIRSAMEHYCKSGYIGTISIEYAGKKEQCPYTTPETLYVQQKLADMVHRGVKVVAMEASSHGLALRRVDGVDFDISIMTSIHPEHLEFHGTMDHYVLSKRKLFEMLKPTGLAVLNHDDPNYNMILEGCHSRIVTYGIEQLSDIMAKNIKLYLDHTELDLSFKNTTYHIQVPVIAMFNVYNIMALVGGFIGLGFDDKMIIHELENIEPVDGRMEVLKNTRNFHVIVDYCQHIEDYKNIFEFVKQTHNPDGKIIAVVGVPSKRQYSLREELGQLANRYCDHVIVSKIDDRGEDFEKISGPIQKHLTKASSVAIFDRTIAVEQAVEMANKDDVVLILGKGHEKFISLEVGQQEYLGDKQVVMESINRLYGDENYE